MSERLDPRSTIPGTETVERERWDFTSPIGAATSGHLLIAPGASRVTIAANPDLRDL